MINVDRTGFEPRPSREAGQAGDLRDTTPDGLWWTVPDSNPAVRERRDGPATSDNIVPMDCGGPYRIRTGDLRIANAALYQLS